MRLMIAAVLLAAAYGAVNVYATFQQEQRIARKIESYEGYIEFDYFWPDWLPPSVASRLPWFDRISKVRFHGDLVSENLLAELRSLNKLESLSLQRTKDIDAKLKTLKRLPKLTSLNLRSSRVSGLGLERIEALTNLTYLNLGDTQVTDASLEHLKGLTSLTYLDLSHTQVSDAGLDHLKVLVNLRRLNLTRTQVYGPGLEHLKRLPKLEALILKDSQFTSAGFRHLQGPTSLTHLDLGILLVTDEARATLLKALPNCSIKPAYP
ncbi:MAG: inlA 5 [Schlesneria sp.]|nr:inlA 5 [Schlesneria sp.]